MTLGEIIKDWRKRKHYIMRLAVIHLRIRRDKLQDIEKGRSCILRDEEIEFILNTIDVDKYTLKAAIDEHIKNYNDRMEKTRKAQVETLKLARGLMNAYSVPKTVICEGVKCHSILKEEELVPTIEGKLLCRKCQIRSGRIQRYRAEVAERERIFLESRYGLVRKR